MKIGDLVELSAKGKSLKVCKEFTGMVGLVRGMDFSEKFKRKEWYYIDWCGGKKNMAHLRTDLKFVGKR
tara:strand:- start:359 stop:565 length:207 start_codon:yes stop_codon:yes gene_type:complete